MTDYHLRRYTWFAPNEAPGVQDPAEENYATLKVNTVGWVVAEDVNSVTLARTIDPTDPAKVFDTITIPKSSVYSNKNL